MKGKSVIICADRYLIDEYVQKHTSNDDFEVHTFFADELNMEEFGNIIYTRSLFHTVKLIVVYGLEALKKYDELALSISKASYTNFILAIEDEKKCTALQKLLPKFKVVSEGKKSNADIINDIIKLFESKELNINKQTAMKMWDMIADMNGLKSWADKLSLYYHNKKNKPEELLNFMESEPRDKVFSFLDNFLARNSGACIKSFTNISDIKNTSIQILSMLSTYMGALYFKMTAPALNSNKNPLYKGSLYFLRAVDANAGKWKTDEVRHVIDELARLDLFIKTGRISSSDALITLMAEL